MSQEDQDLPTYKLPDNCVVSLGGVQVELVLGFGKIHPENAAKLEEAFSCRLHQASVSRSYDAETHLADAGQPVPFVDPDDYPDEEDYDEPVAVYPQQPYPPHPGAPPAMFPQSPPPPQTPAEIAEEKHRRQVTIRLNTAQSVIGAYNNLRHHQIDAAAQAGVDMQTHGEPVEDDAWKRGPNGTAHPVFTLTAAERRLYDTSLDFVARFIEEGYPPQFPAGDPSVLPQ